MYARKSVVNKLQIAHLPKTFKEAINFQLVEPKKQAQNMKLWIKVSKKTSFPSIILQLLKKYKLSKEENLHS